MYDSIPGLTLADFDGNDVNLGKQIGPAIRRVRKQRGMKQGTLAYKSGIVQGSLSELEKGTRCMKLLTLYRIARTLGIKLSDLLIEAGL